jgi:hypothetical protein
VTDPLAGVLRDSWHLYRANAARVLAIAVALYGPAVAVTAVDAAHHGPSAWCYAIDALATYLLIVVVAARPPAPDTGVVPKRVKLVTAVVRAAPGAIILAAIWLAMTGSESFMGHFEFVAAIPAVYAMFLWLMTVPVVVIEDLAALAGLRRSWQLIRGHGSAIVDTVAKAYGVWFLVLFVPILVISIPGVPVVLQWVIPTIAGGLGYGPFLAITVTLAYCRLAATDSAAVSAGQSGPDAGPEPAPVA